MCHAAMLPPSLLPPQPPGSGLWQNNPLSIKSFLVSRRQRGVLGEEGTFFEETFHYGTYGGERVKTGFRCFQLFSGQTVKKK
jgi:hypothetical protein